MIQAVVRLVAGLRVVILSAIFPLILCHGVVCYGGSDEPKQVELQPAQTAETCPNLAHSLWEASTRCSLGSGCTASDSELTTSRYASGTWCAVEESDLHRDLAAHPTWTIVFVHGNRTNDEIARCHATTLFNCLTQRSCTPIRLICFSWPSEKPKHIMLPSRLVDEKKQLIKLTGIQLAHFLQRLDYPNVHAIIGFSFGCPVIACALHLNAGGTVSGYSLCQDRCTSANFPEEVSGALNDPLPGIRLGLIAPAMDRCAFQINGQYERALDSVECLVNLYNSRDPILQRFRFFDRSTPIAAGYRGFIVPHPLNVEGEYMQQFDCRSIGATHAFADYCRCGAFERMLDSALGK